MYNLNLTRQDYEDIAVKLWSMYGKQEAMNICLCMIDKYPNSIRFFHRIYMEVFVG